MRIWVPTLQEKEWWLTIFFREVGSPQPIIVGQSRLQFGRGLKFSGKLSYVQFRVTDEVGSIQIFPGSKILGIIAAKHPGIDAKHMASYGPRDEVELVQPSLVAEVSDVNLAHELTASSDEIKQQLQVMEGKRRRFLTQ